MITAIHMFRNRHVIRRCLPREACRLVLPGIRRVRTFPGLIVATSVLMAAGCGYKASNLDLDKELARQSLSTFLDCWARGETADGLQAGQQPIVGRDPDWAAGKKLVGYTFAGESDDGTNLHVTADVVLQENGREVAQQVTYIVGTSPVITVFRRDE